METQGINSEGLHLRAQLLREAVGMAKFALSSGKAVPPSVAQTIEAAATALEREGAAPAGSAGLSKPPASANSEGLVTDTGVRGAVPSDNSADVRTLVVVHEKLSQIVAPATPQAILLFANSGSRSTAGNFLGPVPLVRRMTLAALLSLALFIGMSLFPDVTGDISFEGASPLKLLLNTLFLLAAAGLGASFAALFQINRFVAEVNYDPKFNASYWIKFTLGLIAGLILAELIPVGEIQTTAEGGSQTGIARLAKPTLALLGGFSATVVFRILNRFVVALDTLVRGETRDIVAAQEEAAKARIAEQMAQSRTATITRLVALQQQLEDGVGTEKIKARIAEIVDEFIGPELGGPASTDERPANGQAAATAPGERGQSSRAAPAKSMTAKPSDHATVAADE